MAGMMIAGGLFNAVAFAGAGALFKFLDKDGSDEETERHDRATEELNAAKEKWYENETAAEDRLAEMRQQLSDANADINATNKALNAIRKITYEGRTFVREPHISDYYQPSDEMLEYRDIAIGIGGLLGGWGVYKLVT